MVENITGIKLDGKFELNPMKKLTSVPLAGGLAARAIGGADSAIAGRGFWNGWKTGGKSVSLFGDKGKSFAELTPYRADTMKNRQTGYQELKYRREKEHDGEKLYSDYRNAMENWNGDEKTKPDKDEFMLKHINHKELKES